MPLWIVGLCCLAVYLYLNGFESLFLLFLLQFGFQSPVLPLHLPDPAVGSNDVRLDGAKFNDAFHVIDKADNGDSFPHCFLKSFTQDFLTQPGGNCLFNDFLHNLFLSLTFGDLQLFSILIEERLLLLLSWLLTSPSLAVVGRHHPVWPPLTVSWLLATSCLSAITISRLLATSCLSAITISRLLTTWLLAIITPWLLTAVVVALSTG